MDYLLKCIEEAKQKESDWDNGIYKKMRVVQIDSRGTVGEKLIFENYLKKYGNTVSYKESKIEQDGIYDGKVNNLRVEVKTATRGTSNNTFQHENNILLRNKEKADYNIFVDICPNHFYITTIKEDSEYEKMGINTHIRHTTKAEKITWSESKLNNCSLTIKIDPSTPEEKIKDYFDKHIPK